MNREEILYLTPYLLSLAIILGIFFYTWRHRYVRGARVYTWFVGGQVLTILGFLLELISPNLETKILWDKFQWLTTTFLVLIPFLIFSIQFSEQKLSRPRLVWGFWLGMPILFTLILLTDSIHHLVYPDPHLTTDQPFPDLSYSFTYVVYAFSLLFAYGANLLGIGFLIKRAVQPYNSQRYQFWTVAWGFLIPLLLSTFTFIDIKITPQRDISPFSLAVGNLVVAWGLFRYGLFDIVPIAREHIIENMVDPVVVLDMDTRIVDINPAAIENLEKSRAEVLGSPAVSVFENWPEIIKELETLTVGQRQLTIIRDDDTFYFDLNVSPIKNKRKQLLGWIVVARDVTRHKTLESGYRTLSAELEQRVNERTEELRQTAKRYRAVVENQTEFIVRWKPNHARTFVNDAYCRYFDLSYEQAMQTDFMTLVDEKDRKLVEEKIARLIAGVSDSETEIHRTVKPDGSIAWQEWTDRTIRNEDGEVVEFQSIGRDVTRRKQDEQLILKELEFDTLMTQLLTNFATCAYDEVDTCINKALEKIATFFGGEFADILLLSENKSTWTSTHFWTSPEIKKMFQPSINIKAGALKWSEEKLINGESIRINTLDDYPPEALPDRKFGEEEGIKSLISVPIRGREESIFGVLDIVSYNCQITWSDTDVTHLRIVGDAIANTLERQRAEEALRKSEEMFSKVYRSSPIVITIAKFVDGELIEINETFEKITGYKRAEAIGRTTLELGLWGNNQDRTRIASILASTGELRSEEINFRTKTGEAIIGSLSAEMIELDGEKCVLATIEDITELKRAEEKLAEAYDTTLEGWAKALELRDKETEGHSRRVTEATVSMARAMGIPDDEIEHIHRGSILHDIGKMGIPDDILRKNGPLTDEDRDIVKKHPTTAYNLLKPIPYLKKALEIPYSHHEKWDGSGYPQGLKGEAIPLAARIFSVVDVWDALSSDRPYRDAWSKERVKQYITGESGKHFDPNVVDVFLRMMEKGKI